MGASESPPLRPQQRGDSSVHTEQAPNSVPHIKHLLSRPRPHGSMRLHSSSSSPAARRMKPCRASPTSSSSLPSPSSSSSSRSSDSLAPTTVNFKRSQSRHRSRSPALFSLQSGVLGEGVDDCQASITDVSSATPDALTSQISSSVSYATPPLQADGTHPGCMMGMSADIVTRDANVDKEEKIGKARMWRMACAMAHAYIYQHDVHQHGLNQGEPHQYDLHRLSQQQDRHAPLKDRSPQQEVCEVRPNKSTPGLAPFVPMEIGRGDEVTPSTVCLSNDVICIDEIVNPTQAAEWFGALFLSTSTLVS